MRTRLLYWSLYITVLFLLHSGVYSKKSKKIKKPNDNIKSVSSDKVKNGGNKGQNGVGSFPNPFQIPMPLIPKNKKNSLKEKPQKKKTGHVNGVKNKHGTGKKSGPKTGEDGIKHSKQRSEKDNDINGFVSLDHKEVIRRMRRNVNDNVFSDEEIKLRDQWLKFDAEKNIPSREVASFVPADLTFIWEARKSLSDAYDTVMPHVKERLNKRSSEEDEDEGQEEISMDKKHSSTDDEDLMTVNKRSLTDYDLAFEEADEFDPMIESDDFFDGAIDIVDDTENENDADWQQPDQRHVATRETVPRDEPIVTVAQAEQQLRDAELASKALSSLETKLGVDPENIIPNTHKYTESLQSEKARFDEDIRKHIIGTHNVEKSVVNDNDEASIKVKRDEIESAKEVLAKDRSKIEEIDTELKELKDIELMATGLEVAKFLAKERAQANLEKAKTHKSMPASSSTYIESNIGHASPMPSAMVQPAFSPPLSTLHQTLTYEPPPQMTPAMQQPSSSFFQQPQMNQPPELHEFTSQRHITRPMELKSYPPNVYLPAPNFEQHKQFFGQPSSYLTIPPLQNQAITPSFQMFKSPLTPTVVNPEPSIPSPAFFNPQPVRVQSTLIQSGEHLMGDQRHTAPRPLFSYQLPVISMFAGGKDKKPHNGDADQTHKASTEEDNEEIDWLGSMSFPGTTYSPPPSYVVSPSIQHIQQQKSYQQQASVATQPRPFTQYSNHIYVSSDQHPAFMASHNNLNPGVAPYSTLKPYEHPLYIDNHNSVNQGVAPFSTLKPYKPEPSLMQQSTFNPQLTFSQFMKTAGNVPVVPFMLNTGQPLLNVPRNQQIGASQVITTGPTNQVITVNKQPEAPKAPERPGVLPGYIGAVEAAKYPEDLTERLRNGSRKKENDESENGPKRQELVHAEGKLNDVKRASIAVTNVENKVGFDPGSIVKMIDYVKTAAKRDVDLSKDIINKDQDMLKEIESGLQTNDSPAQKSELDKKSTISSVAYQHAQEKLNSDKALLRDAEDRLEKINKMELVVTEIEVAKYIANDRAEKVVEGVKRTIDSTAQLTRAYRSSSQQQ